MTSRKDSKGRVLRTGESVWKDGRYRYRWVDANGRTQAIYNKDLKQLRESEAVIKRDLQDGIDSIGGEQTLEKWFEIFLNNNKRIEKATRVNYKRTWDNYLSPAIGNRKINNLKKSQIIELFQGFAEKYKHGTVKLIFLILNGVFEVAVDDDAIRKNPCRGVMKNIDTEKIEKGVLTEEQYYSLLDFCRNSNSYNIYEPYLIIAVETCLRFGELSGLQWEDVDLFSRTVKVNKELEYKNLDGNGCIFYIDTPKTEQSNRTIALTKECVDAFIQLRKMYNALDRQCAYEVDGYSNFVFINRNGAPYAGNNFNNALKNIVNAYNKAHADKPLPHLSAHNLRHTGCTMWSCRGMSYKGLQNRMGHKEGSTITSDIYDHASFERQKAELERLEASAEVVAKAQ